jgi:hypothetical protein
VLPAHLQDYWII